MSIQSALSQAFGGAVAGGGGNQTVDNSPADSYDVETDETQTELVEGDGLSQWGAAGDSSSDSDGEENSQSDLSTEDSSSEQSTNVQAGQAQSGKSAGDKKISENVERVTVSDDRGRREIEVDFSDREALKKYVRLAHGGRKWQAERDRAQTQLGDVSKQRDELKSNWDAVEAAYRDGGVQGLVDLIDGKGAYDKYQSGIIENYERRRSMTPAERRTADLEEADRKRAAEVDRIRRENEQFRKQIEQEREQAELRSVQSVVNPSFERYRFAGKLGDPTDEHMFDEMLWNTAMKRLEPYETQGLEITRELVEREFSRASSAIRRRINVSAEKKVAATIRKKKEQATENAQKQVMSGYVANSNKDAEEARELIRNGDLTGLIRGLGKYGKLFGGR
jgi:hypothetical protein